MKGGSGWRGRVMMGYGLWGAGMVSLFHCLLLRGLLEWKANSSLGTTPRQNEGWGNDIYDAINRLIEVEVEVVPLWKFCRDCGD